MRMAKPFELDFQRSIKMFIMVAHDSDVVRAPRVYTFLNRRAWFEDSPISCSHVGGEDPVGRQIVRTSIIDWPFCDRA